MKDSSTPPEPVGTVAVALANAARLLESRPELAAEQAAEILKSAPSHPLATLLLGVARRVAGVPKAALQVLEPLAALHPQWALAHYELALAYGETQRSADALSALRQALVVKPDMADAWRALGDQLTIAGDTEGADAAYAKNIKASTKDPRLLNAAAALCENQIPQAEALLRAHLKKYPTDVAALRMLAEVAARLQRYSDAEALLARCLELAPSFSAARHHHAIVLHRQNKSAAALQEVDELLARDPRHPGYNNLKAAILARIGELDQSIEIYGAVLAEHPAQPKIWMTYGHALKTKGREQEGVAAYKRSIELQPSLGEAYWSLANLKTVRFTEQDLVAMRAQLANPGISDEDRFHLNFALGKALEDRGEYAESFVQYALGNQLRRTQFRYEPEEMSAHVARVKASCTAAFFADRASHGATAPDPIFIVGLPRAGSTLLEQILSSHSQVEGTMELPDMPAIAKTLSQRAKESQLEGYSLFLATLGAKECAELGERYLSQTRIQRKSAAPFFIDKLPNNFAHIDLIHLALPHAKIIDARRHPLGCGFSGFKQHFARGQSFTYSLEDIGRYYRDYVELMAHFDAVLPGRIHRVIYESMIEDTETEVRRLLDYCGLPFEAGCLRFYENERAVRTASSQQVRQPIFQEGIDHWRRFEPWLGPLKQALGSVLDAYPQAPQF
ncbi:MAG TPA: sulfotransferase [Steroidobacteraceae bacterium]|jgi:tetratricopeptide (TPR) repeat protein|nr:sulfotransferase [Steroidobacteraceae bacterium]